MTSRGGFFLVLLWLWAALGGPVASFAIPSGAGEDRLSQIESRLSIEKERLKGIDSQEKGLIVQVCDLEKEVMGIRNRLAVLDERILNNKLEIQRMTKDLAKMEHRLRESQDQVCKRLIVLYKYARKAYIRILVTSTDLDELRKRIKYLKRIAAQDQRILRGLEEDRRRHEEQIDLIRGQLGTKEAMQNELKINAQSLRGELENKVIGLMKIHKKREFYETAVQELEIAAKALRETLTKIEARDLQENERTWDSNFEAFRGDLPFPLEGRIIKGDPLLGREGVSLHKGIFIESVSSGKVKAVFPGRVDFSGMLKGYGEMIIINHGSRYFTVSALLSRREKKVGDLVKAGEIIGSAGGGESSHEGRLYFEIRDGERILDPLSWLRSP